MPTNTYVALDKVTVGTATPSITFSSIPQGYTDLVVVAGSVTVSNDGYALDFKINGDTGSNYSLTNISGNGTTVRSDRVSNGTNTANDLDYYYGFSSSSPGSVILNFMNYSNSTTYKTVLARSGTDAKQTEASVHLWRSTAAITSIEIGAAGSNIAAGSTFSLYGIKSEAAAAKATGGYITSDATYFYHTFLASGTFTPQVTLSADVLVVAGGGGAEAGGGGAGGLLAYTSQSLSIANHSVTVGAGGAIATSGANSQFASLTASVGGGGAQNGVGRNGGSGAGGGTPGGVPAAGGLGTAGQGNNGGNGGSASGGGGGGASAVGTNASGSTAGNGGNGSNAYSTWASATSTGVSGYYAGGGGGGSIVVAGTGGLGGGANGSNTGNNAAANTGGGGGGYWSSATNGAGGSGVVIVRYAK